MILLFHSEDILLIKDVFKKIEKSSMCSYKITILNRCRKLKSLFPIIWEHQNANIFPMWHEIFSYRYFTDISIWLVGLFIVEPIKNNHISSIFIQ